MMKQSHKVALVHDVFIEFGGAERVLLELIALYPDADIYVPLLSQSKRKLLAQYCTGTIHTSWLNAVPFVHSASIILKPLLYLYWQFLDVSNYDLVISSSHSFSSKGVITGPNTYHLSYVHTPPRYLYVEFNETQILRRPFFRAILTPLLSWLRMHDFISAQRADMLVANSKVVAARIAKYYRRRAQIVYPPVRMVSKQLLVKAKLQWQQVWQAKVVAQLPVAQRAFFAALRQKKYYVCFSRLSKQKGIDLAVKVCSELQRPLLVIGDGSQKAYLQSLAGKTVAFTGAVSDFEKASLLSQAKGLIYCSIEEDFGMVTAEALAHGIPVIGYNSGGTPEIVTNSTGILFDNFSKESLAQALRKFEKRHFTIQACQQRARIFAAQKFATQIQKLVAKRKRE